MLFHGQASVSHSNSQPANSAVHVIKVSNGQQRVPCYSNRPAAILDSPPDPGSPTTAMWNRNPEARMETIAEIVRCHFLVLARITLLYTLLVSLSMFAVFPLVEAA